MIRGQEIHSDPSSAVCSPLGTNHFAGREIDLSQIRYSFHIEGSHVFVGVLERLRTITDSRASEFHSEWSHAVLRHDARELNDEYLRTITDHLQRLAFKRGILISAELGKGSREAGTSFESNCLAAHCLEFVPRADSRPMST